MKDKLLQYEEEINQLKQRKCLRILIFTTSIIIIYVIIQKVLKKKSKQDDDLPNGDSTSGDIKLEERRI